MVLLNGVFVFIQSDIIKTDLKVLCYLIILRCYFNAFCESLVHFNKLS